MGSPEGQGCQGSPSSPEGQIGHGLPSSPEGQGHQGSPSRPGWQECQDCEIVRIGEKNFGVNLISSCLSNPYLAKDALFLWYPNKTLDTWFWWNDSFEAEAKILEYGLH